MDCKDNLAIFSYSLFEDFSPQVYSGFFLSTLPLNAAPLFTPSPYGVLEGGVLQGPHFPDGLHVPRGGESRAEVPAVISEHG